MEGWNKKDTLTGSVPNPVLVEIRCVGDRSPCQGTVFAGTDVQSGPAPTQGDRESEPETQKPPYLIRHASEAPLVTRTGMPTVAAEPDKHAADLQA